MGARIEPTHAEIEAINRALNKNLSLNEVRKLIESDPALKKNARTMLFSDCVEIVDRLRYEKSQVVL